MKNRFFNTSLVLLIFSALTMVSSPLLASNIIMGTIKFPENIKQVPLLPIWSGGFLLKREADEKTKEVSFQAPRYSNQNSFYLIVTKSIHPFITDMEDDSNNVAYLKVPEGEAYKLFFIELQTTPGELEDKKESQHWYVEEQILQEPIRRIPDNAIIILYHPDSIAQVQGGSSFSLPTIKVKDNLLELVGSEEKLLEDSAKLAISSIGLNTFHTMFPQKIKFIEDKGRTLVAPAA